MITSSQDLCRALEVPFSQEQLAAITAPLGPSVIVAGAGTGKTTVMAARVAWLVGTGQVAPQQVLGLTFTRKAAGELSDRIAAALRRAGHDDADVQVQTYDSFSAGMVSEHGLRLGLEVDQTLITGATRYRVAARTVEETRLPLEALSQLAPSTVIDRVLALDAHLAAHLVSIDQVRQVDRDFDLALQEAIAGTRRGTKTLEETRSVVAARGDYLDLVGEYRALKKRLHLTEFADQMVHAVQLARAFGSIRESMREQYRVVLLDEYQDTSAAQAILLSTLFSGASPAQGRGHPVTAVGDPFQAIYGWRGAAPANILAFPQTFPCADGSPAPVLSLTINRRSRGVILDAANQVSAPLLADPRLGAGIPQRRLRSPDDNHEGRVRLASFDTWYDEVDWVADAVVAAHDGDLLPWSQIAVLTRRNASIGPLWAALVDRDVPVEIVGLGGLLEVEEVDQVVSMLTILDDPTANPQVVRLLSGRRWRISPRDLAQLAGRARHLAVAVDPTDAKRGAEPDPEAVPALLEAIADPGPAAVSAEARSRLRAFHEELTRLRRHLSEPVTDLIHRIITTSGVRLELDSDPRPRARVAARQLDAFVTAVGSYVDLDGDGSLSGLLAWLETERDRAEGLSQAVDTSADSVKLMTVHRSKGLEWEIVFLPGLVQGGFPSTQPPENWTRQAHVVPAELRGDAEWVPQLSQVTTKDLSKQYPALLREADRQAEDRLAYVALTRARRELVLSHHHWAPGRKTPSAPSFYVETLHAVATGATSGTQDCADGTRTLATDGLVIEHQVEPSEQNPILLTQQVSPWPPPPDPVWTATVSAAAELVCPGPSTSDGLDTDEQIRLWRALARRLLDDRGTTHPRVHLPASIPASGVLLGHRDPKALRDQLVRPMPRPVTMAASVGTQFHTWLQERFGRADHPDLDFEEIDEPDPAGPAEMALRRLREGFESGPYADRVPVAVETPFILTVGEVQIRGRIDAVFMTEQDPDHSYRVVDWKTSETSPDPLQLSIYRLAWARAQGVEVDRVDAVFHHVRSHLDERPARLLDAAELASLLTTVGADMIDVDSVES